jgi:hypothetical protein
MTTIEEFKKTATPKQIKVIDRLATLHKEGLAARADFQEVQDKIDRRCSLIRQSCGLQSYLIDDELELFVDPLLPARADCADDYRQIHKEMTQLLKRAVGELNMGHLGYVQRNYEKITGEPVPNAVR